MCVCVVCVCHVSTYGAGDVLLLVPAALELQPHPMRADLGNLGRDGDHRLSHEVCTYTYIHTHAATNKKSARRHAISLIHAVAWRGVCGAPSLESLSQSQHSRVISAPTGTTPLHEPIQRPFQVRSDAVD